MLIHGFRVSIALQSGEKGWHQSPKDECVKLSSEKRWIRFQLKHCLLRDSMPSVCTWESPSDCIQISGVLSLQIL